MLIIGAAGGNEIQASLFYGAGQIDAVELNPVTVSLLRGEFADYAGNITRAPERQLRPGRRANVPRPQRRRVRHHLVRRARQLRRVQRRHVGRVRAVGELPLHRGDDRERVRPPRAGRGDRRPVRRPRLRRPPDAHGPLLRDRPRGARRSTSTTSPPTPPSSYERGDARARRRPARSCCSGRPVDEAGGGPVAGSVAKVPGALTLYLPGAVREDGLVADLITCRTRGRPDRRRLPARHLRDRRRPALLLALHDFGNGAHRLGAELPGRRDRHRRAAARSCWSSSARSIAVRPAVAAVRRHPPARRRRRAGMPGRWPAVRLLRRRSGSASCSSRSR